MNMTEIKQKTGQTTLMFKRQMDQNNPEVATPWITHWDNDNRVRVTMHEDVNKTIQAKPDRADLALKYELIPATADRAAYARYVIITPIDIVSTY